MRHSVGQSNRIEAESKLCFSFHPARPLYLRQLTLHVSAHRNDDAIIFGYGINRLAVDGLAYIGSTGVARIPELEGYRGVRGYDKRRTVGRLSRWGVLREPTRG